MGISWDWKEADRKKLFGQTHETDMDFESVSKAKEAIDALLASYECKGCGSRDLSGGNILIEIAPISLFHEVKKKRFFGGEKLVEEHWKDVWRVGGMVFKSGGIFGGAGYINCNNCKSKADADNFCIATGVDMTKIVVTPEALKDSDELDQRYADHLKFLWEQYNKLMGLGVIASSLTLGFLLQGILFNKDIRSTIKDHGMHLDTRFLMVAVITAILAALSFVISRWCSQILMERQVYGRLSDATQYFRDTLQNETIWPTALQTKKYLFMFERTSVLKIVGNGNEYAKFAGIGFIIISWVSSFVFAYPMFETLTAISNLGMSCPTK